MSLVNTQEKLEIAINNLMETLNRFDEKYLDTNQMSAPAKEIQEAIEEISEIVTDMVIFQFEILGELQQPEENND